MIFAYIIYNLEKRFNVKYLSLISTSVMALSFAVVTVKAQSFWKNNLSLWEYAVSESPESPAVKINYGDALRNSGKPLEALENYTYAYENSGGLNNKARMTLAHGMAITSIDLGNYKNAEKWLDVALNLDQRY